MTVPQQKQTPPTLTLDGQTVSYEPGETLYQLAQRQQKEIPSLCYDPRLEPFGGCRLCAVELDGVRNPVAACTTPAAPGMVVRTTSARLEKLRHTLLEMVASENRELAVDPLRGYASQELTALLDRYDVKSDRFQGAKSGRSHLADDNPFILRDYDLCISCYRCVRVCAEQEGDFAISVMNRGFQTQISTEFNGNLKESACTFCGQCLQTCPTGALADKKAMRAIGQAGQIGKNGKIDKTRTICPYCGVGCSVDLLTRNEKVIAVQPAMDGPANLGALCVKGQFAFDFVHHPDRLTTPLVRDEAGQLRPAGWDEALERAAAGFQAAVDNHGRHSVYGVASGRAPSEAAYLMQKFMRVGFGSNNIDNCSRA